MDANGSPPMIRLRGVAVHNLKEVDLDLPHRRLIAFCGVSGSGKTSLALDTLYTEGQRRYVESFSTYTRQFLEQLDKPAAESIEGIPPSVAVTRKHVSRSSRATVGSATQVNEHLQLLFARLGEVICYDCGERVERDSAESAANELLSLPAGTRLMLGFKSLRGKERNAEEWLADLAALGYRRCILAGKTEEITPELAARLSELKELEVVIDRVTVQAGDGTRLRDSLENALEAGRGAAIAWIETGDPVQLLSIDDRTWTKRRYSNVLRCERCNIQYPDVEPQLLNYNNPLGACKACEGFGNIIDVDMQRVVPDAEKSLRDGAIAPWNTPAYSHELDELLALAPKHGIPVDVPFRELNDEHLRLIREGVPEKKFGGLNGFFSWLERRKYKMHIRVFLSRWRSYYPCPTCGGARLKPEALAVRIAGWNIAEAMAMRVSEALAWLRGLMLTDWQRQVGQLLVDQVTARLGYLERVGVGHLAIDRSLRTLSGGEAQRVSLTAALGSNLTGMLYVLDEPSAGLHPADLPRLVEAVRSLRERGNTVALVEHEPSLIQAAEHVVEMGPGAGEFGGKVIFQGSPVAMLDDPESRTGEWIAGRRIGTEKKTRRPTTHGWLKLVGARGNNLQNVTAEFPLGLLCVVTGVSGAGKSTLVQQTLFPAVAQKLRMESDRPADFDDLIGAGQVEDALRVDQSPIGRTPRSNPVTYVKAFDPIRTLFAETTEAKARSFKAGHFSFNAEEGRCEACQGDGYKQIDMRFMADVYIKCPECHGARYRREVLEVKYRGLSIADVLNLSVREAFNFFRGHKKVLARLKCLIDVGLDYLRLGQPANTLSGGESQRLKLANYVSAARKGRTLFVLDEPTTGLHFSDVMQLIECFESLVAMGHSLIVVEHNLQMMRAADYIIDLGPGPAEMGGQIVAVGTPEEVARNPASVTGQYLAEELARVATDSDD
ncbi:excinuclease ABC subunit A [Lacipirellula parvula]|uniref:UvrABC system protein A n=2 Tax=Lacipirellula parvula TaxID=2650471 RepID=A0A5K7X8I6_9BACT|nr:excinuclease ABC subunit A [Lacipirellula parvula]